ncbi:MAG: AmmeMemoRadiSam system radical SAM enzyme, partial [Anaerolineae bacterium]
MVQQPPFVREALLQERAGDKVRCLTCERRCLLAEGQQGWCRTREHRGGRLVTLTYGLVSSLSANPIEKKPLYHFHPGSVALTVGSYSCNFACPWCQNWEISKQVREAGRFLGPEAFVRMALDWGCQGTSVSLNEPTLSLEWALDLFPLAREAGLYNTFVTNGYMTGEALQLLIAHGLDAMNVDVKGDAEAVRQYCGADVEVVWRNCRLARASGVWVEVTTLVIPGVNDAEPVLRGIARRIVRDLGPETPWHVNRYWPAYQFHAGPTPLGTLEKAWQWGREEGLHYVYVGNVGVHRAVHTWCPRCGALLVERRVLGVRRSFLVEGRCPACGHLVPLIGSIYAES